ncbi:hypothetical protein [Nitrosospira sp. Is2]|uniref:hypothetical protein n=1 Tax=Nitrosospira sp. Is2 TaxID=3080532 RepID=UPI00295561BA|nr:hypothetical protein [Nitrosospira sp. Is2]WON74232.1 hypothetical protein R5L00_01715 [Nitrosospira sp. Is2]
MNRRLEKLEDAMLRENGGPGYKLVMVEDDEMPEDAIATAGLLDWPPDRIFLISFVKADQKFP